MTAKKDAESIEIEEAIHSAMLSQDTYFAMEPVDCWGIKLIGVFRDPGALNELLSAGKFNGPMGEALRSMIFRPYASEPPEHTLSCVAHDGKIYALYSICRNSIHQMVLLTFERPTTGMTEDVKAKVRKALAIAEKLSKRILAQQIKAAQTD